MTAVPSDKEKGNTNNRKQSGASQIKSIDITPAALSDPLPATLLHINEHTAHGDGSGHSATFTTEDLDRTLCLNRHADAMFDARPEIAVPNFYVKQRAPLHRQTQWTNTAQQSSLRRGVFK